MDINEAGRPRAASTRSTENVFVKPSRFHSARNVVQSKMRDRNARRRCASRLPILVVLLND